MHECDSFGQLTIVLKTPNCAALGLKLNSVFGPLHPLVHPDSQDGDQMLALGKSWACKHWKIQNNYFVISL